MKIIFDEDDAEMVAEVLAIERGMTWDSSKPYPPKSMEDDMYTTGPWTFCGHVTADGSPYCPHHKAIASGPKMAPWKATR